MEILRERLTKMKNKVRRSDRVLQRKNREKRRNENVTELMKSMNLLIQETVILEETH